MNVPQTCDRCGKVASLVEETDDCDNAKRWLPNCSPKFICKECADEWSKIFAKWRKEDPYSHRRGIAVQEFHTAWHRVFDPWFKPKEVVQFT